MAKCAATKKDGEPCTRDALPGKRKCAQHGRKRTKIRTRKKDDWRPRFLKAFAEHGLVIEAAAAAGVGRSTVYDERQKNESFALAWADIEEWTTEEMEHEARRRAVLGVDKPVFFKGEQCGKVREYSDTLLIFMLKARKPETYRETVGIHHSGKIRTDVPVIPEGDERMLAVSTTLVEIGAA